MDFALGWTLLLAWTVLAAAAGKTQYGEFYDLKKYEHCRKQVATAPNDRQCDYLKLTRRPQPAWMAADQGRFSRGCEGLVVPVHVSGRGDGSGHRRYGVGEFLEREPP